MADIVTSGNYTFKSEVKQISATDMKVVHDYTIARTAADITIPNAFKFSNLVSETNTTGKKVLVKIVDGADPQYFGKGVTAYFMFYAFFCVFYVA